MRKRSKSKLLRVNGVIVEAVTIAGLSEIIGKSKDSILRYEKMDVFPPAPLSKGKVRYYPVTLANRLVPLVSKISPGKNTPAELVAEINKVFQEEIQKLCQH